MTSPLFSAKKRVAERRASFFRRFVPPLCATAALALCVGCGTTKFSDTGRTATEQLLISSAMEDVVDEYDYSRLAGLKVFLKVANSPTDADYLKSLLRQQLAANGVFIKDSEESADYILEVAPGTVGTNRYELMYGIPETTIPAIGTVTTATSIPEFALIKRTDQKAQVKLVMWAYNKTTGAIVWQSGVKTKSSNIRDRWVFGAGPFTDASYDDVGVRLGADAVALPSTLGEKISKSEKPSVRSEAVYQELDADAIERLEKIRKEGLAGALEADAKENGLEVDDGKSDDGKGDETNAPKDGGKNAQNAQKDAGKAGKNGGSVSGADAAKSKIPVETSDAAKNSNSTEKTVAPGASESPNRGISVPSQPSTAPTLVFGDDAVLELRSVYVPDEEKRY